MSSHLDREWKVELFEWEVGLGIYGNGVCRYYNATVDMLSGDGETCTVTFEGYGTTVIVRLTDLRPRGWEEEEEEEVGIKKKKLDARPNAK